MISFFNIQKVNALVFTHFQVISCIGSTVILVLWKHLFCSVNFILKSHAYSCPFTRIKVLVSSGFMRSFLWRKYRKGEKESVFP